MEYLLPPGHIHSESDYLTLTPCLRMLPVKAALLIALAAAAKGQLTRSEELRVTDPRPLAKAADLLELKYGFQVIYEDPAYEFAGDMIDQTSPAYRFAHPDAKVLIPRGGPIAWNNVVDVKTQKLADPMSVLRTVTAAHTSNGNPGLFDVRQSGGIYMIVPIRAKNEKGDLTAHTSPLDANISIPTGERSGVEILRLICDAVTQASGVKIVLGTVPINMLTQKIVTAGAANEPARDVLLRALAGLRWMNPQNPVPARKLSWRLFYGPDVKMYALNIHIVVAEVSFPAGGTIREPI